MLFLAAITPLVGNLGHQRRQVLPPLAVIFGHVGLAIIAFVFILLTTWRS